MNLILNIESDRLIQQKSKVLSCWVFIIDKDVISKEAQILTIPDAQTKDL